MNQLQQKVLDGSRELFYKYGVKRITMDDIARHIGMSKKTIYETYSDKDELVQAMATVDFAGHEKNLNKIRKESGNAIDEIVMTMQFIAETFARINPNVFYDLQKYHRNAWNTYSQFKTRCVNDAIISNLKKGIEEGLYRKDLDIKVMAQLRVSEMDFSLNPEIFPPQQFNMVQLQVELVKHFLFGISTLKGHKLINKMLHVADA